jgi:molybdate transport system ATP-binding protein
VSLRLRDVEARRDGFAVGADLEVATGETVALVGPNGAGKSTLIDAVAGTIDLAHGEVWLGDVRIDALPPQDRGLGVTFQGGRLFPRMTALENVAFPLRARGTRRAQARRAATDTLARLAPRVDPSATPGSLSGGERQRIALARALVHAPRALLLDEPLAAVDVSARSELRAVLRQTVATFGGPCVIVAHDPIDALTLANRIAIVEAGRVVQIGTAEEVRRAPLTAYAADLVGVNVFRGALQPSGRGTGRLRAGGGTIEVAWPHGVPPAPVDDAVATVRPVDVSLHLSPPEGSARNVLEGPVEEIAIHADRARVRVGSTPPIVAEITLGSVERLGLRPARTVFASFKALEATLEVGAFGQTQAPGTLRR